MLYEIGECNTFLDYFWNQFPTTKGVAHYQGGELDFNKKLAEALVEGYYQWYGSLTTPPCQLDNSNAFLVASKSSH